MSKILISYRREDSAHVTGRIYDRLTQQFGRTAVFKDVDNIPLGIDFRTYLDQQVAKCDVFLAIIGRHWMKPQGQKGKSRLADPADFVRLEIEAALKRQILVIPVLVEGASIPSVDRLPASLHGLSYRNGIVVRPDPDFHRDMDRLIEHLRVQIEREQEGLPPLKVPQTASGVGLTIEASSLEVDPPGEKNIEAVLQPSALESQPEVTPPQEEASVALSDAHSALRDKGAIGEPPPTEVERMELESSETAVPPSELDSQLQVEQGEEEPVVSAAASRITTDGFPSNSFGSLGLIVAAILLIGAAAGFLMLRSKPSFVYSPPMLEKKEELVAQAILPPPPSPPKPSSPPKPIERVAVAKKQEKSVEKRTATTRSSINTQEMIRLLPGSFMRGVRDSISFPINKVTFTRSFAIAQYETTFDDYDRFAQATGRPLPGDMGWGRGLRPVINVTWDDANAYAEWLSKQTGKRYRLPTDAEWEYAARSGGKHEKWAGTSDKSQVKKYAVYDTERTEPVGSKQPNGLGLYDMSGNVYEWVEDCWHKNYYIDEPTDGSAWLETNGGDCLSRVRRGGSWDDTDRYEPLPATTTERIRNGTDHRSANIGFRLAMDVEP